MSTLEAVVKKIDSCDSLHIVKFDFKGQTLTMMSLDLAESIKEGVRVKLTVKPSHVAIGKDLSGELSYSNRLNVKIKEIEEGKLLSCIVLEFDKDTTLESIITKDSVLRMGLGVGQNVMALIKASEISIGEVIDE